MGRRLVEERVISLGEDDRGQIFDRWEMRAWRDWGNVISVGDSSPYDTVGEREGSFGFAPQAAPRQPKVSQMLRCKTLMDKVCR